MTLPLHIALVSAFPPALQSLNEYGFHLAKGLAARDDVARVTVLADISDTHLRELDLGPKVQVRRVWRFNGLGTVPALLSALRALRPDGVLFNLQVASFGDREIPAALGLCAPALARVMGIPSGVIAHNIVEGIDLNATQLKGQRLRQALVRLGGRVVSRAMTLASYTTTTLQGNFDLLRKAYPGANIALVPHGSFDAAPDAGAPLSQRPLRIVTMGKFGTYKRLETLLAAFARLRDSGAFAGLELVIGGSDHPATPGYLAGLAQQHADKRDITFAGYLPEDGIGDFFRSARVSVFDYNATTGSSGVLHQTASYGALPVFPAIGDFVDVTRDEGIEGRHFEPGNPDALAEAIADVLSDIPRWQPMADANLTAAADVPFDDVVGFHTARFAALGRKPARGLKPALGAARAEGTSRA